MKRLSLIAFISGLLQSSSLHGRLAPRLRTGGDRDIRLNEIDTRSAQYL